MHTRGSKRNPRFERFYPVACQSLNCGAIDTDAACIQCPMRPALEEFRAWCKATDAYQPDDIWSRSLWRARNPQPEEA